MWKRRKEPDLLMDPIERVMLEMEHHDPPSEEYDKSLDRLERMIRLKKEEKGKIDPNTLVLVAGNLLGILVIVAYEQKHVMASKAVQFILRPRA